MESNLHRSRESLKTKLPDIKKTLETVIMLKSKHEGDQKELNTNFLLSDNIWAKARIPNTTGKVGLWLGANVMVEYSYTEALVLLGKNLANAEAKIKEIKNLMNHFKTNAKCVEK